MFHTIMAAYEESREAAHALAPQIPDHRSSFVGRRIQLRTR